MVDKLLKQDKILVVDDNPKNIQVIASILTNANYSIGYATDGSQALNTLKHSNEYDLILLDIDMPVMNGLEACRHIRNNPESMNIPVIFLTAFTDMKNIVEGFEAGAQDYISKPFNSQELLSRVKTHIELKKNKEILLNINGYLEEMVHQRTEDLIISNKKLDAANIQLKELDAAKTEFLHILSHEIRTPLNGIMGSVELLKSFQFPEPYNNLIHILNESVKRLENFSYKTLDISNLNIHGDKALTINFFNLEHHLDNCLKKIEPQIVKKHLTVQTEFVHDAKELQGDLYYIDKSLNIILENAVKHSKKWGLVRLITEDLDEMSILKVMDSGNGFSSSMLTQSFIAFSTGENHINNNIGLDLHFVKLVMDAHHGQIEIGNNPEGGAFVKLIFKKTN